MAPLILPSEDPLSVVNKCIESLEKLVNLKTSADRALYVGSIERLQLAVCSEESAMKHFVSSYTGGIPLLVSILEKSQDQHIRHFAILIMEKMLFHKPGANLHAQAFVLHGAVDHLLKLIVKCQLSWGDDFICSLYRVTVKVSEEDKKFAVKARFLGVLPVIVSHIKAYAKRYKVLNSILKLLKKIMSSSVNATKLSKDGLPKELMRFLDDPKKTTIIPVLDATSEATRTRHAARQFVKEDVIPRILQILFTANSANSSKSTNACTTICKIGLRILVHLTQIKIGREKLLSAGTIPSLLNWCKSLIEIPGNRYNSLVALVSSVVQRCLPARPLPVRKLNNPVVFAFSESFCLNESDSSEGRNDDTLSLASSTLSSADSGTDSEEEIRPFPDHLETQYSECIDQFSVYFEEINDPHEVRNHFSGDDGHLDSMKSDRLISSPVSELRDLKINTHIPKLIQRLPNSCAFRKDLQRKLRKPPNDISLHPKEKSKSPSLNNLPTNVSSNKFSRKCVVSDSMCDAFEKQLPNVETCDPYNLSPSERHHLLESAKEERKNQKFLENVSTVEVYQRQSMSTVSVSPFVKLAYPDVHTGTFTHEKQTKLIDADPYLIRREIFRHTEQMAHGDYMYTEVYNFDSLVNENHSSAPLSNNDEQRIYTDQQSEYLRFEARFESGNLRKVFWKGNGEYDIILNPDINSKSHLQWFYFEVSGMKSGCPYTFNIINMEKTTSQYNEGMCPVMFSVRDHVEKKQGWKRIGSNICYYRNHYTQGPSTNSILRNKPYYTLTFTVTFQHANDVCYFAYHYPYTFSTLQTHIYCWQYSHDTTSIYFKIDELCKSLSGNSVPLLTITAKPVDYKRPYIFLTARVHPGESNSSWVMKGALDYLLCNKSQRLREMYIFKIVPMLNPDGVVNGCHRCSLSGQDLNRQWVTPNMQLHPTIFYTKSLMHYLASRNRKPQAFCDFHGHSRRSNAFFFGCNPQQSWWPSDETKQDCESFKILPVLMNELAPTFSLDDCEFTVERSRESTGRVTVWRQFDVPLSYTLECSYGGCNQGRYAGYHLGIPQLEDTGIKLCQCFAKLIVDSKSSRVWTNISLDMRSFPLPRLEKISRSKFSCSSTSTETDDDYDDCDDDSQFM